MFVEEGIYKVIGTIVVAVFFFILVCRLLGFQAKVIEGATEGMKNNEPDINCKDTVEHHATLHTDNLQEVQAGNGELRATHEDIIIKLEKRIGSEILNNVINCKGNPLLANKKIIDNDEAMNLITKLNELCKFRDTLEVAINTLDNTEATTYSSS